ncbi:MAG: lipopolysaccharide assembly protein LapA domain-containing protein [Emcibacter sp.]|nr:lipopolysaccharide assembly protein LapA domain-containing protein [Emcibacter sp.]
MRIFYLSGFILFTALCVIIAVSNKTLITFSLDPMPFTWELPIYLLLFIGIFIGLGIGIIVMIIKSLKYRSQTRKQTKKINALTDEIQNLENEIKNLSLPENS